MANYCGKTRTNYFEVNDKKAFKEFVESLLSDGGKVEYMENKDGLTGFCCDGVIYGRKSDKTGLEKYADMKKKMVEKIQGFLRPGYACIITELGWEAFRWQICLVGCCLACCRNMGHGRQGQRPCMDV